MRNFTRIIFGITLLVVVSTFQSMAATFSTGQTQLKMLANSSERLVFENTVGEVSSEKISLTEGVFSRLSLAGYTHNTTVGTPELPVIRQLIEIPYGAQVKVKVVSYDEHTYSLAQWGINHPLVPVQPSQSKCGPTEEFQINTNMYETDQFNTDALVSVDVLGRMRGVNIARVDIAPVRYNPVTNTVKVFENLKFELVFENGDLELTRAEKQRLASPYFTAPYNALINYTPVASRENLTTYPVKYVIVSDPMFADQLQPFIQWKTRKGFTVVEAYTDVIGTSLADIKAYLQGLYDAGTPDDPAPSFVLFVGDIDEIPAYNNGNGVTDRNYVEYTGDLFPEIFYGRFSAQNADQLQPYIDKTLQYEQFTMPNPTYLDTVVMVAGMDGSHGASHGNGQINYGTINYFNEDHGIFSHTYLYPESGSNANNIHQNVSDGVTFANYTAHCSPNGWADPSFSISDIANLQNQDKYGLLIGNCCSSSEYQTVCFAEEILRAPNKGAVGYIGGSNSTYWDEDYYFGVGVGAINENPPSYEETGLGNYDRAFHDHGEPFAEWYTTMDQQIFAGNLAVSESGSGFEEYYWDIYNLMGDPSLMIYYSLPPVMPITFTPAITIGQTSITISAVPYAYVGLSMNNQLHGMGIADASGNLMLEFDPFVSPGDADLVVTAQNYQPIITTIPVIPADGPYVVYESHQVTGLGFTYHESEGIELTMENVGSDDALDVEVVLSTNNPYITLTNNTVNFGTIPAGQSVQGSAPFQFTVADDIPDMESILFNVVATISTGDEFVSNFSDIGHAPVLTYAGFTIDDSMGNGNGKLDQGETANFVINLSNTGSATAYTTQGLLSTTSPHLTINQAQLSYGEINAGELVSQSFNVTAAPDAPSGVIASQTIEWMADFGISGSGNFNVTIGQIPVLIVDLAQSNNTAAEMQQCFTTLTVGSEMSTTLPDDLNIYQSLFISLGTYPDNHVLSTEEGNKVEDFISNGGRVYMEGGDTWAYDPQTLAHAMFHINGTGDGTGDLSQVTGEPGSFAANYDFVYDGANSYIDHIVPTGTAFTLFKNAEMGYDVAVAYENDTYKTIGTSFEFGGLENSATSTKDGLMAEILYFFQIPFVWTGIEDQTQVKSELLVYPNPATQTLTIELNASTNNQSSLSLLDMLGREVMACPNVFVANGDRSTAHIDVSQLNSGVYYVVVTTPEGKLTSKIVVNN